MVIYTNKNIPEQWKNKFGYEYDVLKYMKNDKNFLFYLGNGGNYIYPNHKESNDSNLTSKYFSKNFKNKRKIISHTKRNMKNNANIKELNIDTSNNNFSKNNYPQLFTNFTDKQIIGLLEEYKNRHPLFHKVKNNELNNQENLNDYYKINLDEFRNNSKTEKTMGKKDIFRKNIFTNLLPSKDNEVLNERAKTSANFYKKKFNFKEKGSFLSSDNELFYKRVNITNNKLLSHLKSINFFGPYFSFCPPCNYRNLNFYKNLDLNQCIKIIKQIKKSQKYKMYMKENYLQRRNTDILIPFLL